MLKKGYILFPKVLFEEQLKMNKRASGYCDAFMIVLLHANYSDMTCTIYGRKYECRRGESMIPMTHWAKMFGWGLSKTRNFFEKMYEVHLIEKVDTPSITHIRFPDYDLLVGQKPGKKVRVQADGLTFEAFWEKYHDVTQLPKTNIGLARREWKKLTPHERSLSLKNIDEYYDNLRDTKYCLHASSYLANKAFLNEYNY